MDKHIPNVPYSQDQEHRIEVMDFSVLISKLEKITAHNPFAVHKIDFNLILVLTEGVYTHFVDFKSYVLQAGSTLFIAKNQVHHFTEELSKANGYVIVFDSFFMDKHYFLSGVFTINRLFNYHIGEPVIHEKDIGKDTFTDIAAKLFEEYCFPNDFAKTEILSALLRVLLLKAERAKELQAVNTANVRWLETFRSFKDMLETDYIESRSSRFYASKLFVSYKFLNDVVKQLTGKTAKVFIDDFVIMEIKRYLVSTSLSIKEIGYKTGFEEPANMIRFFKKNTQITPLKFRQNLLLKEE